MGNSFAAASAPRDASFLWVNLTREARTVLDQSVASTFDVRRVREPAQIPSAIQVPSLAKVRTHPSLRPGPLNGTTPAAERRL